MVAAIFGDTVVAQPVAKEISAPLGQSTDPEGDKALPSYPVRAVRRGTQGHVLIQYDVLNDGKIDNVQVLESYPGGVFEKTVLEAAAEWQFEPPHEPYTKRTRVTFRLQ